MAHTARGERARIARELHDVVAHHISMIAVQAETGRLTTPGLPEAGARRFARDRGYRAGRADRDAAAARRAARGRGGAATTPDRASRQPQPGLAQLAELIDAAREASVAGTRLIISGPVAPLDPGVELAAYRIVQEALTNARRHAPGAAVDVELRYGADTLRLRVRDNGPGRCPPGQAGRPRACSDDRRERRPRAAAMRDGGPAGRRDAGAGVLGAAACRAAGRRVPRRGRAARRARPGAQPRATVEAAPVSEPPIGIVVADDHEVVRAGFAALLDTQPDFSVLGTAADGADAVRSAARCGRTLC